MSRAWQAERAAEREEEAIHASYSEGRITLEEYNRQMRELQRDMQAAYEQDREEALRDVDAEWGRW